MHQQLACSVRSGLVVSDLSRKENNLLLVYKDVSERKVVFQIKKKIAHARVRFSTMPIGKDFFQKFLWKYSSLNGEKFITLSEA